MGALAKLHSIGFSIGLVLAALVLYIGARVFHLFLGKRSAEKASLRLMRFVLKTTMFFTPGLRLRGVPSAQAWKETVPALNPKSGDGKKRGYLVMVNHTSQLDGFLFSVLAHPDLFANCRTLMKSSLFKTPIAGALFRMTGALPVFFLRDDQGSFSVDKDKQAPVTARLKQHFEEGGILSFCPEGAINREDPRVVADFRRGTFQMAIDFRLPIYGVSSYGNHNFWRNEGGLPGQPTTIDNQLFAVEEWNKTLEKAGDDKPITMTAAELSNLCRTRLQMSVDTIVAKQEGGVKEVKGQ